MRRQWSPETYEGDFFKHTVRYLGHKITPSKLGVLEANTRLLRDALFARTQTQLKSVLGMCKVSRLFVKNFSRTARPLTMLPSSELTKNLGDPGPEELAAFNSLKQSLLEAPFLALPQSHEIFVIDVDACDTQVRCTLLQPEEMVSLDQAMLELQPVGYFSRTLSKAERSNSATERERLGVV